MFLGLLTLLTALTISAVAIYYSVAGLVAIFAAAAVPIMIMGGVLEISKLVTAVWLHRYWRQATWWLKTYLSTAVVVLMLITSMGIFGFLSKAHIEQTSASEETVARVETITKEIDRQLGIVGRAENKIRQLETSGTSVDTNIQAQIDKEQERIDKAFERIQPAIDQQNKIIKEARSDDATRTKPYEDQLTNIQAEVLRLETSAKEYETKIENLDTDSSGVEPLLKQIDALEEEIIRVTNQLNSKEQQQIRAGQAIIGVTSDGLFGGNTRTALAKWVQGQRDRITQIQGEIAQVRKDATSTVDAERVRLAEVVKDIRTVQIPALKERELVMLGKIDEVRQTESPAIKTARDEIQRLRKSAEDQVAQSQTLISRLQEQLANTDNTDDIQKAIDEQNERVRTASNSIDQLTEERIALESEYRKLEAEVGPIKYIAEFVYGEAADKNMLEEAVRWVIIIIIFVFDPLAVLLLIASQYTFEWRRSKDDNGDWLRQYEQARAQRIVDNPGYNIDDPASTQEKEEVDGTVDEPTDSDIQDVDVEHNERDREADDEESLPGRSDVEPNEEQVPDSDQTQERTSTEQDPGGSATASEEVDTTKDWQEVYDEDDTQKKSLEFSEESKEVRVKELDDQEEDDTWQEAKQRWKDENPNHTLKFFKQLYIDGKIDEVPWAGYVESKNFISKEGSVQKKKETQEGYIQNEEQTNGSIWKTIKNSK
jgi:hypothetical protein